MDITVPAYQAIYQVLSAQFQKGIEEVSTGVFNPIMERAPSASEQNLYNWLNYIPGLKEWYRGQSRVYRNVETKQFNVFNRTFEDTLSIPINDVEDNQLSQYSKLAQMMGRTSALLPDQLIAELFNGGFTTTTGYDATTWFSDSHTVGLSTVDNKRTAVLSSTSYGEALTALHAFTVQPDKDSAARPLNPMVKAVLVVPPQLLNTARTIVEMQKNNYGADNVYYKTAEILVSPWLTSSAAWFLMNVGGGIAPVFYQERMKPQLLERTPANSDRAFNYDELIWGVKARGAALPTFPWLAIGSTGADS